MPAEPTREYEGKARTPGTYCTIGHVKTLRKNKKYLPTRRNRFKLAKFVLATATVHAKQLRERNTRALLTRRRIGRRIKKALIRRARTVRMHRPRALRHKTRRISRRLRYRKVLARSYARLARVPAAATKTTIPATARNSALETAHTLRRLKAGYRRIKKFHTRYTRRHRNNREVKNEYKRTRTIFKRLTNVLNLKDPRLSAKRSYARNPKARAVRRTLP